MWNLRSTGSNSPHMPTVDWDGAAVSSRTLAVELTNIPDIPARSWGQALRNRSW